MADQRCLVIRGYAADNNIVFIHDVRRLTDTTPPSAVKWTSCWAAGSMAPAARRTPNSCVPTIARSSAGGSEPAPSRRWCPGLDSNQHGLAANGF
jgi:hypothetical protein